MPNSRYCIFAIGEHFSKRKEILQLLAASGYDVIEIDSPTTLQDAIKEHGNAAIGLVDLKDPSFSGYEAVKILKENSAETQIIVISQKHSTKEALEAHSRGAFCYFSEPLDVEEFLFLVAKASIVFELAERNRDLESVISGTAIIDFVSGDVESQKILSQVQRIADVDTTVLLTGETGTGKTALARIIHQKSNRAHQPFISVSCASIPRELLEAELFGYERGAFTGAQSKKVGCIELANKGTLFLDEIGDLSLELQPKLLTFLQDRQLRRVGGTKTTQLDVRIIAATNKDLASMVQTKNFREDLFFRLNVVNIAVPSLRARKSDITALAESFLMKLASRRNQKVCKLSKEALKKLDEYSWPGNIRELENVLERASLFCAGQVIESQDLALLDNIVSLSQDTANEKEETLEEIEKHILVSRLQKYQGNKQKAAISLGISLKTIYNKMQAYGL